MGINTCCAAERPEAELKFGICNPIYVPNSPSDEIIATYCDDIVVGGYSWIRTDMVWGHVQAGGSSSWNWVKYDTFVDIATQRGLKLLFILGYSVGWANGDQDQMVPPLDNADYANFATEAVRRYAPLGVTAWEIWNEPNLPGFWKPAPDAAAYAQMLKAAYVAMKAVEPDIIVLMGGMASTGNIGSNIAPHTFLQSVYDEVGQGYFDAMNYHPYGWSIGDMNRMLTTLHVNGDAGKKIWFTEYGNPTGGTEGQSFFTEDEQASLAVKAIQSIRNMPFVEHMFIYSYKDNDRQPDREGYFGIKRLDDTAKPAYAAIRDAL